MDDARVTASAFTEALGAEIAYWRKRRGLGRDELADKAGISKSTMGRIERDGPKDVSDTWRLAAALNVPFLELVRRAEEAAEFDADVDLYERVSDMTDPDTVDERRVQIAARLDMEERASQIGREQTEEEVEAQRAVDRLDHHVRNARSMQQMQDQAARDEDRPKRKGRRS